MPQNPRRDNGRERKGCSVSSGNQNKDNGGTAVGELRDAARDKNRDAMAKLFDAELVAIDTAGRVLSRDDAVSVLLAGADRKGEAKFFDYGPVVLSIERGAEVADGQLVIAEVWVRRDDGWRLLIHHENVIAAPGSPATHPPLVERASDAPPPDCPNPLDFVPYDARSESEKGIIHSFQSLEKDVVSNNADQWVYWVADEFEVFRTKQHPTTKAQRAEALRRQKKVNAEIFVAAVEAMRLWVFGDVAVMRADHLMPGNRRPPYRATRIWVNRDGRWQMAVSQQTTRSA
jgi:hypothetical protein